MIQRSTKSGRGTVVVPKENPVIVPRENPDWIARDGEPAWARILTRESLEVHFQPIISLKKRSVIGVEALARPTDGDTGRPVTPLELFAWAARNGRTVDLDRLC